MPIRNALVSIAFALSASGIAADVHAQGSVDKAYKEGPCSNDLKKFCARVKQGDGRIAKCLAEHQRELEPACQGAMTAARDKLDRMAKACKADAEKYCKGVRPGEGRILSCLKGRESDLNPACAAEFKRAHNDPAVTR